MRIGTFTATDDGYAGRLHTLSLDVALALVPASPSDNASAPDYRVMAGEGDNAREVGAAWKQVSDKAGDWIAVRIDDPSFARPLRASLFHGSDNERVLVWSRPVRRERNA
jgi:uncharacterized protein (DUF736 family)